MTEKLPREKIAPYIPIWKREPNKFIRYEMRKFDFGRGFTGQYRIAFFEDKKGKIREEVAQVIWDNPR